MYSKALVRSKEKRLDGLGLLKEVIQLVRVTRPLDKLPQRRDGFGAPPVFGTLLNNLFGDGSIFEAFSSALGSSESQIKEVELAVDILNILVFYQGPERLRTHLASEGRCIAPPTSDSDRICWKPGSSLFTALLFVFERYESTRVQMFTLLKEIFKVPLGHVRIRFYFAPWGSRAAHAGVTDLCDGRAPSFLFSPIRMTNSLACCTRTTSLGCCSHSNTPLSTMSPYYSRCKTASWSFSRFAPKPMDTV